MVGGKTLRWEDRKIGRKVKRGKRLERVHLKYVENKEKR
jgi:hypothetical protein